MEILLLLVLYLICREPTFEEKVKPLFDNLKSTEDVLKFMKNLSSFSSLFQNGNSACPEQSCQPEQNPQKNPSQNDFATDEVRRFIEKYFP